MSQQRTSGSADAFVALHNPGPRPQDRGLKPASISPCGCVSVATYVMCVFDVPGEVVGDILSVTHSPEGLRQLVNLPAGSAEAELGGLLPLIQVYQYLETTRSWDVLGADIQNNSADLRQKIREGEETLKRH